MERIRVGGSRGEGSGEGRGLSGGGGGLSPSVNAGLATP